MAGPQKHRLNEVIGDEKSRNQPSFFNSDIGQSSDPPVFKSKEGLSWSIPLKRRYAYTNCGGLIIAEIFFETNEVAVKSYDDTVALDRLVLSIKMLLNDGFKIHLQCVGHADYRGSFRYNLNLGMRRAQAVKNYIENRIFSRDLKIDISSLGEIKSLQSKDGRHPSNLEIMKDRKVIITFDNKGITPPVTLAITGDELSRSLYKHIETLESNNEGNIGSLQGSSGYLVVEEQHNEDNTNQYDPSLPTVLIEVHSQIIRKNNTDEIKIECVVKNLMGHEVLFTASAQTDKEKLVKEKYQSTPKSKVSRTLLKDDKKFEGFDVGERTVTGVFERSALLWEDIYNQLKGPFTNITKHVEAKLPH